MNYFNSTPYNAPTMPYNQFSSNGQQLIRVNGLDGAKAYQMNANSTVALFDSNEDVMYIKTTDGAGFGSIRQFNFTEIPTNTNTPTNWIGREEFEQFKREVMDIGKHFIQFTKSDGAADVKPSTTDNE